MSAFYKCTGDTMTTQLNAIEARESTIGHIFSDEYAFEIPPYQRPYAWEQEQVEELLSDLLDAMDNGSDGSVYFLGSIVLIKSPNQPPAKVVDGQQRLTTLTMMLSVLRDLSTDPEVKIVRRNYVYQKANPDSGAKDRFRLLLRQRDQGFFQKYIQNPDATKTLPNSNTLEGSQQNIARNCRYLRTELEGLPETRRNALVAFLIQRCYLVVVAVPTAEAARRIFTVLNARAARRPAVTAVLWSRYAVRRRGSKDQPSATQRRNDASIVFLRGVTNGRLGGTAPPSRWSPLLAGAFGYGD
jgi:hypothetical protein